MKALILMNAGAGSIGGDQVDERQREVREACAAAGIDAEIQVCEPARLRDLAREAARRPFDVVIAAGGDGTVSAVASGLAGTEMPLGVLPLGTLNHFARDIHMPDDLTDAAKAIASSAVTPIDVAEVNGRTFINNSSIGLYPEIVVSREHQQKTAQRRKYVAMAIAAWRVLKRFPLLAVRLVTPERTLASKTPFVFVGNNPYVINVLELGKRERLDCGKLSIYMVRCNGRLKMFWLMVRAILQRLDAVKDFEVEEVCETWIDVPRRVLKVAVDGEVVTMTSPLHYKIRPGGLRVRMPVVEAAA